MTTHIWDINAIQAAMRKDGSHWWDASSMRFFGTRAGSQVYNGENGVFFVTSEKSPHGKRAYTVRQFLPETNDIHTVGELESYKSRSGAHDAAKRAAGSLEAIAKVVHQAITEFADFVLTVKTHGNPTASESVIASLIEQAKTHQKIMVEYCNTGKWRGVDIYDAEGEPCPALASVRDAIRLRAKTLGATAVKLGGDPRGCTVKLVFADGYTNDFGKEGVCVPIDC